MVVSRQGLNLRGYELCVKFCKIITLIMRSKTIQIVYNDSLAMLVSLRKWERHFRNF